MNLPKMMRALTVDLLSSDLGRIGFVIGVIMPLLSAVLYPLYYHEMTYVWQEWTRLLELPFVACEIAIIALAQYRGLDTRAHVETIFRRHPWATSSFVSGLFLSSIFLSRMTDVSVLMSLITLVHLWFGMAVYHLALTSHRRDWDRFTAWLAIGLLPLALLTAWRFNFPPARSNGPGGAIEWSAALPGFISVRHFGSWTSVVAVALLARYLFVRDADGRGWWLAGYGFAAMLTIWSGTRAGVLIIAAVPAIMALGWRYRAANARLARACAVTGLAFPAAWLLLPDGVPEFQLFVAADAHSAGAMSGGRLELWQSTFERWLDSPWFGWGTGSTFWEVSVKGWAHTQPHNFVLEFLISWGVIGGLAALFLVAQGCALLYRRGVGNERLVTVLAFTLSLLLLSLQEGMLHYPRFIMLVMIGIAAFAADVRSKSNPRDASAIPLAQFT